MKRRTIAYVGMVGMMAMLVGWSVGQGLAADTALNTAKIEQLTGVKGELNDKEGVLTVRVPRTDLAVTAAGVKLTPPMGLTAWAAFQKVGDQTMVMGGYRPAGRPGESGHERGVEQWS